MTQSRTHNCNELRLSNAGEKVTLVGWYENLRKVSKNLGFLILRDFYGTTQIVVETEEMMEKLDGVNKESTISVTGTVRERSNKNTELPTGEIEVVPEGIEILDIHLEKLMVYFAMVFAFVLELIQMRWSSNFAKWKQEVAAGSTPANDGTVGKTAREETSADVKAVEAGDASKGEGR